MASQAGPLMTRHVVDGHEVLLPPDAVLRRRMNPTWPLCPICIGAGGSEPGEEVWICGECGGDGQIMPTIDSETPAE